MVEIIQILQLLDLAASVAINRGIDFQKYAAARDKARSENRMLTPAELQALADQAQAAIDAI